MPFTPTRKFKLEALARHERYLSMPRDLRLFLLSLLIYADQKGREEAKSLTLREALYEFDDDLTTDTIDEWLLALESRGWLVLYVVGRRMFFEINPVAWALFVSVDKREAPPHPEPPDRAPVATQSASWGGLGASSGDSPGGLRGDSGRSAAEGKGEEGSGWMSDPDLPPPQGCPKHPNNTGLIRCGPCAGARKIHERFIAGEMTHEEAVKAWSTTTSRGAEE